MKAIKNKLLFNVLYFILWLVYFIIAKACFLFYYSDKSSKLTLQTIMNIFKEGIILDISMAAYLCVIPFLLTAFGVWYANKQVKRITSIYTYAIIFMINFLMFFDIGLYEYWGIRLDVTPFVYLDTPSEMLASISTTDLIIALTVWLLSSVLLVFFFQKILQRPFTAVYSNNVLSFSILILITAILIIPIRGGFQNSPINQSSVYFSDNMFANHAAVNFAWNFSHSVNLKEYDNENPFNEFELQKATKLFNSKRDSLINKEKITYPLFQSEKPNVILIIWESLTAKLVEPLGGEANVTHHFNVYCKEGILFENFYANGDRSDKGLVSVLSGYYPQPHKSIIKLPNKTRNLPMLPKKMNELGYTSSFYYGGNLNFMNMNTYLRSSGISKYVDGDSFSDSEKTSKWGVQDDLLFKKFKEDLREDHSEPFLKVVFTLSSHNPYDFSGEYKFGKDTEENKFRSSHAFTDKAVHEFIQFAKQQAWWNNTLVVIMADHGNPLPEHEGEFNSPKRFHVPMLWLGGALQEKDTVISNYCSQSDFAYTLLDLLNGDHSDFIWGKNLFSTSDDSFAHYIFNKGFGTINKNGYAVYDYIENDTIDGKGNAIEELVQLGKATTQVTYQDFIERH